MPQLNILWLQVAVVDLSPDLPLDQAAVVEQAVCLPVLPL
jgi:hypothetical protein